MWTLLQLTMFSVFVMHQVASAQNDCGNTSFSGSEGVVTSPNFPLPYPHNLRCTYSIDVGRNKSVLLKFLNFDLEVPINVDQCTRDWLMITCNEANDENLDFRKRYCGTDLPRTSLRFFNCPVVQLIFFADSSVNGGGFVIEYTVLENSTSADDVTDCGDTLFTSSSGFIRLPENPTDYLARVNCTYTISTNYTSTFSLDVLAFQQPQLLDSLADCSKDHIMVGCVLDGETELYPNTSKTYCRRSFDEIPSQPSHIVFFNCSMVKISIHSSDYNYRGHGSIPFTVVAYDEECGFTSFTGPTGIVTSPHFPLIYPHSLICVYSIDVDRTKTVSLDFLSFTLEGTSNPSAMDGCSYDWITISCLSDGSGPAYPYQNRKYCGTKKSMTLSYSNCDSLVINLITDISVALGGFQLRYTITSSGDATPSTPVKSRANMSFAGPTGFITSPRFPLSYPHNLYYVYSINVSQTKTVGLYFYSFNLEGTAHDTYLDNCHYDWLMISCLSAWGNSHRNRKYCGETMPPILSYSNCDSLTLNFVTDFSVTSGGFKIFYTVATAGQSDCGNTSYSGPNGIVTSPNFPLPYPHNSRCTYIIDVGRNKSVLLKFKSFDLQAPNSTGYCTNDWLRISCSGTMKANPNYNKRYCGTIQWVSSLRFVDCSSLVLEFVSDSSISSPGFMIEYTVAENSNSTDDNSELDCGATLFTNTSGFISLPINPKNYLATVNCTYTISTNHTSIIWLNAYFSTAMQLLQSFQDCSIENLMIGCVSEAETELNPKTAIVFCRGTIATSYVPWTPLGFADCRALKLTIRSNTYDYRQPFRIPFSAVASSEICGNTSFSAPTGIVFTLRLLFQYSKRVNCLYTIDIGHVNSIVFGIDRPYLGYGHNAGGFCNDGWLTITCLANGTSMAHPLAERKLCGHMYGIATRFPACQSVLLNFSSNDISFDKGFSLRYRMGDYELDCGATVFTNPSGFINLPRNPTNYPATVNCTYTISANNLSYIWLNAYPGSSTQLLQSFQDCSRDSLTVGCVSEGGKELNPSTTRVFCHQETPSYDNTPLTFTDCRTLKLSIRSSTYDYRGIYRIPFSVVGPDELCGNTSFSAFSGIVSSPRLPSLFQRRINCLYVIDSGHVNSVVLSVDRLNVGPVYVSHDYDEDDYFYSSETRYRQLPGRSDQTGSCNSGWLTITCLVNETSMAHPIADRKLCGSHHPIVARFPACRSVLLNFSSDYTGYDAGFTVRYRMGDYDPECGNTSFSGPDGFITSPLFPLSYAHNLNCLYSIIGGQRNTISLSFLSFSLEGTSSTTSIDSCYSDWLTVDCFSDESVASNISSSRKYCGIKPTPLRFTFPSCAVVVLNFRSDSSVALGGFNVRYTVIDTDIICGARAYGRPSGTISFPWNYTDYDGSLDCNYVINATEPSSISLTIWSISLQSLVGRNCQRDRLLITCIDNQTALSLNVSHKSCDHLNSSVQLTFPSCTAIQVAFHRDFEATGKTFRIEYKVNDYVSTENPVTRSGNCEVGCEISADGTTCDCSTTQSGDAIVDAQTGSSGKRGRAVGISLTVILVVAGAICLGAFLLFRRHQKKNRSEMLMQASEIEVHHLELEDDSSEAGSLYGAQRDTSKYLPLTPMSVSDHEEPLSSSSTTGIHNEVQPCL